MLIRESEARLASMLAEAGVTPGAVTVVDVRATFSADLTRQFQESGDQDAPLWQLGCRIYWDPTPGNSALASGHLWSFGMDLDDFFSEAVTLPGSAAQAKPAASLDTEESAEPGGSRRRPWKR